MNKYTLSRESIALATHVCCVTFQNFTEIERKCTEDDVITDVVTEKRHYGRPNRHRGQDALKWRRDFLQLRLDIDIPYSNSGYV